MKYSVRKIENLVYDARYPDSCLVDLWLPQDVENMPLFVYFHGGGLENGSRKGVPIMDLVERHGYAVATVEYRMYPSAHFPDFLDDAAACVRFLKDRKEFSSSQMFLGGSSAGGYISMMLCFNPEYLDAVGLSTKDIVGFIHDAGQPTTHFNVLRERGLDTRLIRVDEAAPIYFIDHIPHPDDIPPMLFLYADHDMPCRPEQTEMLIATMKHFKYPMDKIHVKRFDGYKHCEYLQHRNSEGEELLSETVASFMELYREPFIAQE